MFFISVCHRGAPGGQPSPGPPFMSIAAARVLRPFYHQQPNVDCILKVKSFAKVLWKHQQTGSNVTVQKAPRIPCLLLTSKGQPRWPTIGRRLSNYKFFCLSNSWGRYLLHLLLSNEFVLACSAQLKAYLEAAPRSVHMYYLVPLNPHTTCPKPHKFPECFHFNLRYTA